jgi:hypothetical protein
MRNFDARVQALFAEGLPPKVDPVFCASIMEQFAPERLVAEIVSLGGVAAMLLGGRIETTFAWEV